MGVCGLTDYCASKFAVVGLDYSLRGELAQARLENQIKTTIVKPYFVDTTMSKGVNFGIIGAWQPDDVARRIVQAIQREQVSVTIPGYLEPLACLIRLMPAKTYLHVLDLMGGFEHMTSK